MRTDLSEAAFQEYVRGRERWTAHDCWLEAARRSALIVAEKDQEIERLRRELDQLHEQFTKE